MLHQNKGQTGVGRQVCQQFKEGVQAAGRGADPNYRRSGSCPFNRPIDIDARHEKRCPPLVYL
jgi:hypothetical protein